MRREIERLEDRLVPSSVWNEIYVTVGFGDENVTGSLPWAYAKATNTNDQDYENQARIIIVDAVDAISLPNTLINGGVPLTHLDILHEGEESCTIIPASTFRFINHSGNNGIQLRLENLTLNSFSALVDTYDDGNGGAIKTIAPLTLVNCNVINNYAENNGGAIWADYNLTLENCFFSFNVAENSGGAIYSAPNITVPGFIITDTLFWSNRAEAGDGGAIYFMSEGGFLGIYGDTTWFQGNYAEGRGCAVYQYGGSIEAISSSSASTMLSGFMLNTAGSGYGHRLYLEDLIAAHIDINVGDPDQGMLIYLYNFIPPEMHSSWSYINYERVVGEHSSIYSNWPYY